MRVLVLGGSWLFGRLIVEDCARRGFDVTVVNRGLSPAPPPGGVRHLLADRKSEDDLRALARSGPWDAVIDISGKIPAVIRRTVQALADVIGRYVSVSTVMAYRNWPDVPVDEDSLLWDGDPDFDPGPHVWHPDEYGRLKAGCELACRAALSDDRLLVIRLHAMLGQYEDADPVLWWLERMTRRGPALLPAPDRPIQAVDVRDASRFVVDQVERGAHGAFNIGAPAERRTYGAMVLACADVVGVEPELVWVNQDWLVDQGVRQWTDVPLWRNAGAPWAVSVDRALAAGLRCRPLAETAADTWRWLNSGGRQASNERMAGYGLDPAREAAIIARWRAATAPPIAPPAPTA